MLNIEDFATNKELFELLNSYHNNYLDAFFVVFQYLGKGYVAVTILAFLWFYKREYFTPLLGSSIVSALIVISLKYIISAPRPASMLNNVRLLEPLYRYSFPSGDVAVASLILLFFFKKVGYVSRSFLVVYWLMISYGRIYLGVHFPLDILGGFSASYISIIMVNLWSNFRPKNINVKS